MPDGLDGAERGARPPVDREPDGARVRFQVDSAQLDGALRHLMDAGVRSLTSQPPTLEELFLRHYGDQVDA